MATLVQFSDLQTTAFTKSIDMVPIIRANASSSGYTNLKASLTDFQPDSSSYALTAAYAANVTPSSVSSSYSLNADTASYVTTVISSSYARSSSWANSSSVSNTATSTSFSNFALSCSFAQSTFSPSISFVAHAGDAISSSYSLSSSYALAAQTTNTCITSSYCSQLLNQPLPVGVYRVWSSETWIYGINAPVWNPSTMTAKNIITETTYVPGTNNITADNMCLTMEPTFRGGISSWIPYSANIYVSYRMYGIRVWIAGGYTVKFRSRIADNVLYIYNGPSWTSNVYGATSTLVGIINGSATNSAAPVSWTPGAEGIYTIYLVFYNGGGQFALQLNDWMDGINVKFNGIPGINDP